MSILHKPVLLQKQKQLDIRKLIGQRCDGAATFVGKISGVHKRIQTSSAHAIYIHCSCHRLQLASIQAAASVKEIRMFLEPWPAFGSRFIITPKNRGIEGHPGCSYFPELKIVKPSDTRWLSHEHCVRQFARNCLHCCKPFHSYKSHLEMLGHMVYTPIWLVLMAYQAVISCQKLLVPCSVKLVHAEEGSWLQEASLYAQEYLIT